jgi:hypothetical protein
MEHLPVVSPHKIPRHQMPQRGPSSSPHRGRRIHSVQYKHRRQHSKPSSCTVKNLLSVQLVTSMKSAISCCDFWLNSKMALSCNATDTCSSRRAQPADYIALGDDSKSHRMQRHCLCVFRFVCISAYRPISPVQRQNTRLGMNQPECVHMSERRSARAAGETEPNSSGPGVIGEG